MLMQERQMNCLYLSLFDVEMKGQRLTCFENTAISSVNDSELHTSPPATPGSLGVHVANSHFSKIRARRGNKGCLKQGTDYYHDIVTRGL